MTLHRFVPALLLLSLPAFAQHQPKAPDDKPAAAAKTAPEKPEATPEGLPADKSIEQTITVNGKTLHYTATVGTIHLKDEKGKPTGDVMYTSYILDRAKDAPSRPVLFAVNGGPSILPSQMRVSPPAIQPC
jgi:carboxypeptidase C (cathepsin A)